MRSAEWPQLFQWRRFAVDILIAAATLAVAAASVAGSDALGVLVLSGALVGLGMLIEPGTAGSARSAFAAVRPWLRMRPT